MGKINLVLTKILFWPIYAIVAVLIASFSVQGEMFQGFSNPAFFLIASSGLILSIIYWVFEHKCNKVIAHPVYFPIILILTVLSVLTIWMQDNQTFINPETNFSVTTTIDVLIKTKFTIVNVLFFNALYMLIFIISRRTFRLQQIFWFIRVYVIFAIVSIVYSVIKEHELIASVFSGELINNYTIKSFFFNENFFACIIFFAMMGMMVLNYYKSRPYNYVFIFGFYFYMILTTCTSTFFVGTILLLVYIIIDIISTFKKHWIFATIMSSILFVSIAGIIVAIFMLVQAEVGWITSFFKFIERQILSKDFSTFTGRTEIWKNVWDHLISNDVYHLVFGRGFGTGSIFLKSFNLAQSGGAISSALGTCHNGMIEILLTGGLINLSFYAILIILALVSVILLLIKKQIKFAMMYLTIVVSVVTYSFFESYAFFGRTMVDMVFTVFAFIPLVNAVRATYKPKIAKPIAQGDYNYMKMNHLYLKSLISSIIITGIVPVLVIFGTNWVNTGKSSDILLSILICLGYTLIFIPNLTSLFYKGATRVRFTFRCIFYSVLAVGVLVGGIFLMDYLYTLTDRLGKLIQCVPIIVLTLYLIVLSIVFGAIKKERIINYLRYTFFEPILILKLALPISLVIGFAGNLVYQCLGYETSLTIFSISLASFILCYLLIVFIPSIKVSYYLNFINERCLYNMKKSYLKYKI